MPISNSYPNGIPIEDQDLFVGTKAYNNRTVNYTAQGVADYLNINSKVAIGGQMSFQFTIVPNIPKTIAFEGGGGNNTAFSAITKLIVSAIDVSTANITIFLNYLNNSQVLLSQQNQPNFFGHYKITGYTQIGTSAFYELDLEFIGGNGTIGDKQYYDLVSFVLSTEVPPTEWGTIIGDIEDQTDLIDYISSQTTTPTLQSVTDEGNSTTNSIILTNDTVPLNIGYNGYDVLTFTDNGIDAILGFYGLNFTDPDGNNGALSLSGAEFYYSNKQTNYNALGVIYNDYITNKGLDIQYPTSIVGTDKVQTFQDADGVIALLSDITTPTLQEVTDALLVDGYAESTNPIVIGGGAFLSTDFTGVASLSGGFSQGYGVDNNGFRIDKNDGVTQFSSFIKQPIGTPTSSYVWELPNASGTIALTSDITTPTLQSVTDEGNVTSTDIIVAGTTGYTDIVISSQVNNSQITITDGTASVILAAQNDGVEALIFLSSDLGFATIYPNGAYFSDDVGNSNISSGRLELSSSNPEIILTTSSGSTSIKTDLITASNLEQQLPNKSGTFAMLDDVPSAGVTSVGLTMPSAFTVTNSPITSSGDIAVTGAGLVSQYVRGDGTLANFPNSTGGGSSVNYYLNGSVSQGTFGGTTYYQMSKTPILGAGTNFTRTNGAGNGYIASFITDAGDPSQLNIPGGNWNVEFYFNASSGGGSPSFYAELYKVSAANVFTLIASDSLNPESITNGTTVDQYFTSIPVPQTSLLVTDRLAVRIFVNTGGRTITLHTENGNLSEVLTTFTTGLTALNGLTQQVQFFDVGTGATNFNISSSGDTHTFNLLFNIRRNANNSSNNNINYNGYAVTGSAESSAVWTITRLTIAASGSITVATATNVAWTDRETTIYT
jgi:hypothetical protein